MNAHTLHEILDHVCRTHGVSAGAIKSDRRTEDVVPARQVFCWLASELTDKSLPQIGRFINRDHTTVLYSVRKIRRLVDTGKMERPSAPAPAPKFMPIPVLSHGFLERLLVATKVSRPALLDGEWIMLPVPAEPAPAPALAPVPIQRNWRPSRFIRRHTGPVNVTAALMGDPSPARSALASEAAE